MCAELSAELDVRVAFSVIVETFIFISTAVNLFGSVIGNSYEQNKSGQQYEINSAHL